MKIGINALFLIPNQVGGTEYHLRSFISALQRTDHTNEYVIFCNRENYPTFELKNKLWKKVECNVSAISRINRIIYEQFILFSKVKEEGCDILHSYGYFGPILSGVKQIVTVHDTNWLDHPEDVGFLTKLMLSVLIPLSIKRAKAIITDSDFSKERILKYFPEIKNKLNVIKPGVDGEYKKLLSQNLSRPLNGKNYLLCVSAFYPHKRIRYILKVWQEISDKDKNLELVLIGRNGADQGKVLEGIKKLPRVNYFPKVSFKELAGFYKYAKAFVFPSSYEGFGYPVYEALTAGVKCFVSKKDIYDKSIRNNLYELSGNEEEDAEKILSSLETKGRDIEVELNYEDSSEELIKIYQNL